MSVTGIPIDRDDAHSRAAAAIARARIMFAHPMTLRGAAEVGWLAAVSLAQVGLLEYGAVVKGNAFDVEALSRIAHSPTDIRTSMLLDAAKRDLHVACFYEDSCNADRVGNLLDAPRR